MKSAWLFVVGIVVCLMLVVVCYFWATGMMDSLYAFRSPLANDPPAPGEVVSTPLTRRVVFVLIDALRYDTSAKPEVMPYLNALRTQGATALMHSHPPSYSQTGYTMLFTGAWADIADAPLLNLDDDLIRTWSQDNLFSAAKRAGLKTAVSGYYWFGTQIPQAAVDAHFYTRGEDAAADAEVMQAALPMLQDPSYALVLIHIDQVDYAGHHLGGPRESAWDAAATQADEYLRTIVAQLDLTQDTVIIVSDHGQIDRGGHGGQDPILLREPFVLAGKGIVPGDYGDVQMIDVAPTLATLLGVNIPASSEGRARVDMLALNAEQKSQVQAIEVAQKQQLLTNFETALGVSGQSGNSADPITALQKAIDNTRSTRLTSERLGRLLITLLILAFPTFLLSRLPAKKLVGFLAAVAIFLILFNIRYLLISERTYSLTTVESADDIINYTAVTAGISFSIVWLTHALLTGSLRTPGQAATSTLTLTLATLYVLALVMLTHFVTNGAVITWTLPEFNTMFAGFLAMIQSIIVGAAGILLTGLAALLTFARNKFASK